MIVWPKKKKLTLEAKLKKEIQSWNPYCCKCGSNIAADEKGLIRILYCPECGDTLIQPKLCDICGNPIQSDALFCVGCGVKVIRI